MKLINTDGMAFIGPGSEWFWTALSGIVLAVTFIAIYRQLRLQRSRGAVAQVDAASREWDSERLLLNRLDVYVALHEGGDPARVPDGAAGGIADYWEGVGALVRAGHLDRDLLRTSFGPTCQRWWVLLAPYARFVRTRDHDVALFENFEWLSRALDELDSRAGVTRRFDDAADPGVIAARLERIRHQLRVAQALRTVTIAAPEAMPGVPAAAVAAAEG